MTKAKANTENQIITKEQKLAHIAAGTNSTGSHVVPAQDPDVIALETAQLIQTNPNSLDAAGNVQARATAQGFAAAGVADAGTAAPAVAAPTAQIVPTAGVAAPTAQKSYKKLDIPMPDYTPRNKTAMSYPFNTLEVGENFFIGNDEVVNGDAYKAISGTVSNQNRKAAKENTGKFFFAQKNTDESGNSGVVVFRQK